MTADIQVLGKEIIANILPKREQNSSKGTFGHVLNIAGSVSYQGAAYLSSISSLRVGAGYCLLASCVDVIDSVSAKSADITFLDLGESSYGTIPKDALRTLNSIVNSDVISIGCGLDLVGGVDELVVNFLKKNIEVNTPFVIDADAINACSKLKYYDFPANTLITPHPKELSRLIEVDVKEIQANRIKWALQTAREFDCTVLLKGNQSIIATNSGKAFINNTGNSALAKAGTGDVLTGMIAGLIAQGMQIQDAACAGCYLHGLAGDIASRQLSEYCVLASDLIKYIPFAFKETLK